MRVKGRDEPVSIFSLFLEEINLFSEGASLVLGDNIDKFRKLDRESFIFHNRIIYDGWIKFSIFRKELGKG